MRPAAHPQVGYYAPEVFDEIEVQGGQFHVRGVGVPGGGPGVVIGYTPHTAWSITTVQDDQVGTYADRIRPAGGGYQYFWRGAWRPVQQSTETIHVRQESPNLPITGQLPFPTYTSYTETFYRTLHGPAKHPLPCTVVYPVASVTGLAHHRDDLIYGRWISGIALSLVTRGLARVEPGRGRR